MGATPGVALARDWLQLLVHCDPKLDVIPDWLVDMVLKARPSVALSVPVIT